MTATVAPEKDVTKPGRSATKPASDRSTAENKLGLKLVAPAVVLMLLVTAYPMLQALYLSLFRYRLTAPDDRAFVGVDNYEAGRAAGKLVKEALPNGGKFQLFIGRLGQDNALKRCQGVIDEVFGWTFDPARQTAQDQVVEEDGYHLLGIREDREVPGEPSKVVLA